MTETVSFAIRSAASAAALLASLAGGHAMAQVIEVDEAGELFYRSNAGAVTWTRQSADRQPAEDLSAEPAELPLAALTVLDNAPAPFAFREALVRAANHAAISPDLLAALVWQESRWKVAARSPVGAIGLGQLMPGTAQQLGVNPRNPEQNLLGAAIYLRQQLDRFDNDIELALAAYNAGPGRVERARAIPAIAETRNYVAAITGRLSAQARAD